MNKLVRYLRDFYLTIDLRSLGVFRILLACLLIQDWFVRWPNLEAFYTSFGILPVEKTDIFHFSILNLFDSLNGAQGIFLVGLICYFLLLIGYQTRWVTPLCFVFFLSVYNRNTLIYDGGDSVILNILACSILLPLGKRFSLDALLTSSRISFFAGEEPRKSEKKENNLCEPSLAAFAIIFFIATIYFSTSLKKNGPTWREGTAVYYAMHLDQFSTPFGLWFSDQLSLRLVHWLTWASLGVEYLMAPMLLIPFCQPLLRRIAVLLMILFHLGIQYTIVIGNFQLIMIALCSLLISQEDWKVISDLGSYAAQWSFCERVQDILKVLWGKISMPLTSQTNSKEKVRPINGLALSLTVNSLVALVLLSGVLDNYFVNIVPLTGGNESSEVNRNQIPVVFKNFIHFPHFFQDWNMFAPDAPQSHGWLVIDGETASGNHLDPLTGRSPTLEEPNHLYLRYNKFWRKYFSNLCKKRYSPFRPLFAQYLIRENWRESKRPGDRFVCLKFYYISLETRLPGDFQRVVPKGVLLLKYQ